MALPFLKKDRASTGVSIEYRKPDSKPEGEEADGLELASADLIAAISAGDKKAAAAAIRAAFQILDSEPHEEGPHTNEDSSS